MNDTITHTTQHVEETLGKTIHNLKKNLNLCKKESNKKTQGFRTIAELYNRNLTSWKNKESKLREEILSLINIMEQMEQKLKKQ